ncbi:hypothetical protein ABPG72_020728 [Tetrahymena utriculariae]
MGVRIQPYHPKKLCGNEKVGGAQDVKFNHSDQGLKNKEQNIQQIANTQNNDKKISSSQDKMIQNQKNPLNQFAQQKNSQQDLNELQIAQNNNQSQINPFFYNMDSKIQQKIPSKINANNNQCQSEFNNTYNHTQNQNLQNLQYKKSLLQSQNGNQQTQTDQCQIQLNQTNVNDQFQQDISSQKNKVNDQSQIMSKQPEKNLNQQNQVNQISSTNSQNDDSNPYQKSQDHSQLSQIHQGNNQQFEQIQIQDSSKSQQQLDKDQNDIQISQQQQNPANQSVLIPNQNGYSNSQQFSQNQKSQIFQNKNQQEQNQIDNQIPNNNTQNYYLVSQIYKDNNQYSQVEKFQNQTLPINSQQQLEEVQNCIHFSQNIALQQNNNGPSNSYQFSQNEKSQIVFQNKIQLLENQNMKDGYNHTLLIENDDKSKLQTQILQNHAQESSQNKFTNGKSYPNQVQQDQQNNPHSNLVQNMKNNSQIKQDQIQIEKLKNEKYLQQVQGQTIDQILQSKDIQYKNVENNQITQFLNTNDNYYTQDFNHNSIEFQNQVNQISQTNSEIDDSNPYQKAQDHSQLSQIHQGNNQQFEQIQIQVSSKSQQQLDKDQNDIQISQHQQNPANQKVLIQNQNGYSNSQQFSQNQKSQIFQNKIQQEQNQNDYQIPNNTQNHYLVSQSYKGNNQYSQVEKFQNQTLPINSQQQLEEVQNGNHFSQNIALQQNNNGPSNSYQFSQNEKSQIVFQNKSQLLKNQNMEDGYNHALLIENDDQSKLQTQIQQNHAQESSQNKFFNGKSYTNQVQQDQQNNPHSYLVQNMKNNSQIKQDQIQIEKLKNEIYLQLVQGQTIDSILQSKDIQYKNVENNHITQFLNTNDNYYTQDFNNNSIEFSFTYQDLIKIFQSLQFKNSVKKQIANQCIASIQNDINYQNYSVIINRILKDLKYPKFDQHQLKSNHKQTIYSYDLHSDNKQMHWHINFADNELFGFCLSNLFAQDEIQCAEHPLLYPVSRAMKLKNDNKFIPKTIDLNQATPILLYNVPHQVRFNFSPNQQIPTGIYGNNFKKYNYQQISTRMEILNQPKSTNLIAMAALQHGFGCYTIEQIKTLFQTAYLAFRQAKIFSQKETKNPNVEVTINTGNWGCGAFGNNMVLIGIVQHLAAYLANVSEIVYYTFNNEGTEAYLQAMKYYKQILQERYQEQSTDKIVDEWVRKIEMYKLKWGVSDGN